MQLESKYQILASIFIGGFTGLHFGSTQAFSGIWLPHNLKLPDNSTNTFTLSEKAWIASILNFGQFIGALISGFVSNSVGRNNCLLLFNASLLAGWLTIIFHQGNIHLAILGRLLQGFGVIPSIGQVYLSEVLDVKYRQTFGAILALSASIGITLVYILGAILPSWFEVAWVFVGLVIIQCICLIFIPKSPQWLISQGEQDEAEKSLKAYRGPNVNILQEYQLLKSASETDCNCVMCQDRRENELQVWKEFLHPEVYKPLSLLICLFILQQLSGISVFFFYAVDIFDRIIVDQNTSNLAAISVGAIKIVGSVLTIIFLKKKFSKRLQMTFSAVGMFIAMVCLASIEYAKQYHELETSVGTPILVITSSCFILFHSIGFHVIPWVLLGELCPVKLKSLTSGIVISMVAILGFAVVKIFPIALENVGGQAVYGFFAFISIIAGIFSFKYIPETYGKNVEELSFLYRRKAIAHAPVEIMSTTMNLPNSRKMSAEDYEDMYLSYITLGDLEME